MCMFLIFILLFLLFLLYGKRYVILFDIHVCIFWFFSSNMQKENQMYRNKVVDAISYLKFQLLMSGILILKQ